MSEQPISKLYFVWICQTVDSNGKSSSYNKLLTLLHSIDFYYLIKNDENRSNDGVDLRYRFGIEKHYDVGVIEEYLDTRPCSVLEMMAALSLRCEEDIAFDPEMGDRTGYWFWSMIDNLGLTFMDDSHFDQEHAAAIIFTFLNREYQRDGEGGLFKVENRKIDLRMIEIWQQMTWYLADIL